MPLPIRGIFQDGHETRQPEGFAFDVLNGVVYKGILQNEEGTELHSIELQGKTIINILPVRNGDKVIFSVGDEIGILHKDGTYTVKLNYNLGFDVNYPIDAEAQYNFKDELVVAFTDGLNTPKIINLDDIESPFTINSIEMFPTFQEPKLDTEVIEGGGSLLSSVYYVFIRYLFEDNTPSSPSLISNPIFIVRSQASDSFESFVGSEVREPTNKGIKVLVSDIDPRIKRIQINFIIKEEGVINPFQVTEVEVSTSNTVEYVITGTESLTDLTLSEVIVPPIYYNTIKHLTQIDGILYGASVTEEEPINYQQLANQITLGWRSTPVNVFEMSESYKTHDMNNKKRTYGHGEVYAFYIRFKVEGKWTEAFHIPGRQVGTIQVNNTLPDTPLVGLENDTNQDLLTNNSWATYLSEYISINADSRYYQLRDTSSNITYDGNEVIGDFGYWENQDETYPNSDEFAPLNGSEDLRGQKVRHHKFPSQMTTMLHYRHVIGGTIGDNFLKTYKDILGLEITSMPVMPAGVEGYEILYAERTPSTGTTVGNGIVITSTENGEDAPDDWDDNLKSSSGNLEIVRMTGSEYLIPKKDSLRIYAPDSLMYKSILPDYIEQVGIIRSDASYIGTNSIDLEIDDNNWYEYDTLIGFKAIGAAEENTTENSNIIISFSGSTLLIKKLTNVSYVPQNIIYDDINNRGTEEFIKANVSGTLPGTTTGILTIGGTTFIDALINNYIFPIVRLCIYKRTVYSSFISQKLVSTGVYNNINSLSTIYGGDFFVGLDNAIMHSYFKIAFSNVRHNIRIRTSVSYLLESVINTGMRYIELEQEGSKFYPKENITTVLYPDSNTSTWFLQYKEDTIFNRYGYNRDFSSINNINAVTIYNSIKEFVAEEMYKIVRSSPYNPEERNPSWRQWKANDYHIIQRNKGHITNIQGFGHNLFVNTENSLFISRGNEVLSVNETDVAVGTGNIFDRPFQELILDNLGYTGCQHKFSCLLTPLGYLFIDVEKKKIFLSDGSTVKDISRGLALTFEEKLTDEIDNPFIGQGYTSNWDEKYSRIILSKISGDTFTYSYTPTLESWTSRHSYVPDFLFRDRWDLYGLKNGKIFVFNRENYGQYFEDDIQPFHIVGVINEHYNIDKLLSNINWRTQVNLTDKELLEDKTFDEILIWNSKQSTGNTTLDVYSSIRSIYDNQELANTRRAKGRWNFNRIRDLVENNRLPFIQEFESIESNIDRDKDFEYKRRLIDTFFMYKLLFTNQKISNLNQEQLSAMIQVLDVEWKIKPIGR